LCSTINLLHKMIRDIILKQKEELEQRLGEKYIRRDVALASKDTGIINVIIGPRRAGKSFFGMHEVAGSGPFGFVNFDDERLVIVSDFDEIQEAIRSVYQNPKILLLDEIQNLPHWELIVNRLQREGYQLLITGSNSNLMSSELATHLTGRYLPTYIFTFSFKEYLGIFEKDLSDAGIKEKFLNFLTHGGYPEPSIKPLEIKAYLQVLFDSILFKDIVKRHKVRFAGALENLANWLISNISTDFSFTSLSKQTQISSVHTLQNYLNYLEEAFIFFTVPKFSYKIREQQKSNKKLYCFDNGFYLARAFQISNDYGKLLENLVAIELKRRSLQAGWNLYYWKGREQEEVDFVIQQNNKVTSLVQVCWDVEQVRTKEREVRSLLKASRDLKCSDLIVITNDFEGRESFSWFGIDGEIRFIPARTWLLE
jgi:predicted AAA+ superfamily ATPase